MKIKTVKSFVYPTKGDENDAILKSELEYNKDQQITLSVDYMPDGEFENKMEVKYDEQGRKTEEIQYMDENEVSEHFFFEYNEKGRIAREVIKYADGSESILTYDRSDESQLVITQKDDEDYLEEKTVIIYNSEGHEIEKTVYNEDEEIHEKFVNNYEDGILVSQTEYGAKEEFISNKKFEYDKKGNILKEVSLNKKGKIIDYIVNTFDEKDRLLERKIRNMYLMKYEYDDEKRIRKHERYSAQNVLEYSQTSKYNDQKLLIEEQDPINTTVYKYEFYNEETEQ